jgi:hypothetical protein
MSEHHHGRGSQVRECYLGTFYHRLSNRQGVKKANMVSPTNER